MNLFKKIFRGGIIVADVLTEEPEEKDMKCETVNYQKCEIDKHGICISGNNTNGVVTLTIRESGSFCSPYSAFSVHTDEALAFLINSLIEVRETLS